MSTPFFPSDTAREPFAVPPLQDVEAGPAPVVLERSVEEDEEAFFLEDSDLATADEAFSSPFQLSHAHAPVSSAAPTAQRATAAGSPPANAAGVPPVRPRRRRLSLPLLIAIGCVVLVLVLLGINALLPTTPLHTGAAATSGFSPTRTALPQPTTPPTISAMPTSGTVSAGPAWVPQTLPAGWTEADLGTSDALEAEQVAMAFTEGEMSLDYRSVGTRATHGGTMTASTALLTPNAMQRFLHNDVRMMNNTLFDLVARTKLIRVTMDSVAQLQLFSVQGQQQFAWVDVSFQYWLSQINAQTGQRSEGMEVIAGTHLPRSHHLGVLLLRVTPTAMGGTGWLVSNYALDLSAGMVPDVVQPA